MRSVGIGSGGHGNLFRLSGFGGPVLPGADGDGGQLIRAVPEPSASVAAGTLSEGHRVASPPASAHPA